MANFAKRDKIWKTFLNASTLVKRSRRHEFHELARMDMSRVEQTFKSPASQFFKPADHDQNMSRIYFTPPAFFKNGGTAGLERAVAEASEFVLIREIRV
jgi:hypothetical protein